MVNIATLALAAVVVVAAQQPSRQGGAADRPAPRFAKPTPKPPLFFREAWPAAVTNPGLELRVYDPNARRIAEYAKTPPPGSLPRDWIGDSCVILAGTTRTRRHRRSCTASRRIRRTCGRACMDRSR